MAKKTVSVVGSSLHLDGIFGQSTLRTLISSIDCIMKYLKIEFMKLKIMYKKFVEKKNVTQYCKSVHSKSVNAVGY